MPVVAFQETWNEEPLRSSESAPGIAVPLGAATSIGVGPATGSSAMGVADHAGSSIAPVWPDADAFALTKPTLPKFVRGTGMQTPPLAQSEGASTIHSALETSGAEGMVSFFTTVFLRV
jgi:hypothetical protein